VTEQTCVIKFPQGNGLAKYKSWVHTTWAPTGSGRLDGNRFFRYDVHARLEFSRPGRDKTVLHRTCDVSGSIDGIVSGTYTCQTPVSHSFVGGSPERAFTGDGTVVYDVVSDGRPRRTMRLHGTPRV
jgi:hypothetical protein